VVPLSWLAPALRAACARAARARATHWKRRPCSRCQRGRRPPPPPPQKRSCCRRCRRRGRRRCCPATRGGRAPSSLVPSPPLSSFSLLPRRGDERRERAGEHGGGGGVERGGPRHMSSAAIGGGGSPVIGIGHRAPLVRPRCRARRAGARFWYSSARREGQRARAHQAGEKRPRGQRGRVVPILKLVFELCVVREEGPRAGWARSPLSPRSRLSRALACSGCTELMLRRERDECRGGR